MDPESGIQKREEKEKEAKLRDFRVFYLKVKKEEEKKEENWFNVQRIRITKPDVR